MTTRLTECPACGHPSECVWKCTECGKPFDGRETTAIRGERRGD